MKLRPFVSWTWNEWGIALNLLVARYEHGIAKDDPPEWVPNVWAQIGPLSFGIAVSWGDQQL